MNALYLRPCGFLVIPFNPSNRQNHARQVGLLRLMAGKDADRVRRGIFLRPEGELSAKESSNPR